MTAFASLATTALLAFSTPNAPTNAPIKNAAMHSHPMLRKNAAIPSHPMMVAAVPAIPVLAASCTVPTTIGFWKSEYGVSYAYGGATAIFGTLLLRAAPNTLAAAHAAAIMFYGIRLNLFLLWRELSVERFRTFREKVEEKAVAAGSRVARTPFVLSCSLLYYCMCAPLLVTNAAAAVVLPIGVTWALKSLVASAWAGLLIAAWGDLHKSWVKARQGSETLVMSGPYKFFRHPNYTGEQILWTANMLTAFVAAIGAGSARIFAGTLVASVVGWLGIMFVLGKATANLEAKQAKRFQEFVSWKRGSWSGFALSS